MESKEKKEKEDIKDLIGFTPWEIAGIVMMIILIIGAPYAFTQWNLGVGFDNGTGAIGDTIGGITAPFVNLLAAYLVYKSFTAQIRANKQQRDDHNEQMMEIRKDRRTQYLKSLFDEVEENFELTEKNSRESKGNIADLFHQFEKLHSNLKLNTSLQSQKVRYVNSANRLLDKPLNSIEKNTEILVLLCNELFSDNNSKLIYIEANLDTWYRHRIHTLLIRFDYINLDQRIEKELKLFKEGELNKENIGIVSNITLFYQSISHQIKLKSLS